MENKKSKRIIALLVAVIVILIVGFAAASLQAETIKVEGNEQYTDQEIKDFIFGKSYDRNIAVMWVKNKLGKTKDIPFVEKYDIEILSLSKVQVTIYEKSIVGYIDYMGTYMYFDKDGVIVESSDRKIKGIPKITGINYDYVLLHEPIPVDNEEVFDLILTVTQTLQKYKLTVKKIYISENMEITLYKGDVKIYLGTEKQLSEKISELKDFAPKLEGFSGTMDMSKLNTEGNGYTLKRDTR